jgi:hypothetical protein
MFQAMSKNREVDKVFYEIQVKGRLDSRWEELFDGLTISSHANVTTISGLVTDQAALRGLIDRVLDFGLVLISVNSGEVEKEFS